jgi:hypothetical protein
MNGNEYVALLRKTLTRFHDEAGRFMQSQDIDPLPGSVAANERATYPRAESLFTVSGIVGLLIEAVGEHFTAFIKTITEPVEPIACWTCVRSMLESASIAAWLFDPAIDAQTRVGRSFAHRYEGMVQQVKFSKSLNRPADEVKKLEDQINEVENVAAGLGFPRLRNSKNERIGIGQHMPSATDIIKLMLEEERAYRLLSAVAHGHVWAIQQLGFRKGDTNVTDGVSLISLSKHSGTVEGFGYLAIRAAKALGLPIWNQCRYFGWDEARFTNLLESVYDEFKGTTAIRYWRPSPGSPSFE